MSNELVVVRVKLPNGAFVGVEATLLSGVASEDGREDRRIALEVPTIEGVTKAVEGMSVALWEVLKKVAPRKATIEFGFEIAVQNGELTGFFVQGSGKTNMKITLEWSDPQSKAPDSVT